MNSYRVLPLFLIAQVVVTSLFVTKVLAAPHTGVTICHATGSQSNPFTQITVDDNAVDGNGNEHNDHNMSNHQNGEDIIPAGNWDADGRNWNAQGQAIWNNNCNIPQSTPTTSASPSASPSQSPIASPSASASASASPSPLASVSPSASASASPSASPMASQSPVASTSPSTSPTPQGSCCTPTTDIPEPGTAAAFSGGPQGEVLGISTLASTGSFEDSIKNVIISLGAVLVTLSQSFNARKKA